MRNLLPVLLLYLISYSTMQACTCFGPGFCEFSKSIDGKEGELIFMGEHIRTDTLSLGFMAMEFRVERLYRGRIITPASPLFRETSYINTDSTVWILSGPGATCMRWLPEERAIFALDFGSEFFSSSDSIGYVPSICRGDYIKVDAVGNVSGEIWDLTENVTMNLSDLEDMILGECKATSSYLETEYSKSTLVFPSPTTDQIKIDFEAYDTDWKIDIVNVAGQYIRSIDALDIDVSDLERGIYFLVFTRDRLRFTKKFVKV